MSELYSLGHIETQGVRKQNVRTIIVGSRKHNVRTIIVGSHHEHHLLHTII